MQSIDLKHVARLSRLHLEENEIKILETQVEDILKFIEKLKEVSVDGVEPTSHPLAITNVFRNDKVTTSLAVEDFLKKSPETKGRFFQVPQVIEENS